jgi:acid phosphatase class B
MIIYVDIDNTICRTNGTDYENAVPIEVAINKINFYKKRGDTIVYWTARGTGSGIDYRELTESQLKKWGAQYDGLEFGKPVYDIFIDDKNLNSEKWLNDPSSHGLDSLY